MPSQAGYQGVPASTAPARRSPVGSAAVRQSGSMPGGRPAADRQLEEAAQVTEAFCHHSRTVCKCIQAGTIATADRLRCEMLYDAFTKFGVKARIVKREPSTF